MALSRPRNAAAPVRAMLPGVCGGCGLATHYTCPQCKTAHFCSTGCLERARDMHDLVCGTPSCMAVDLPSGGRLVGCWINAYLRGGGRFSLHQQADDERRPWALQPSPIYGLVSLQLDSKMAGELAQLVKSTDNRDAKGYLKIGTNSYPGYQAYTAISGEVNNEEQSRVTAQLARRKAGGRGGAAYDRAHGLQYAIDYCGNLRELVNEVCVYLGGCGGWKKPRLARGLSLSFLRLLAAAAAQTPPP